jgi:hypothetical protein
MKLTLMFATFSLLIAAAAALEASSLYDTAVLKRQSVPARSYDHAHPRKYSHSAHAYEASETIKPASPGKCHSIGATGITHTVCSLVAWEILTICCLCVVKITSVSGPNGHIDWLNCKIHGSGWSPAPVKVEDLVVVSLDSARHTTFSPCSDKIIATFKKYGQRLGSSCSPSRAN